MFPGSKYSELCLWTLDYRGKAKKLTGESFFNFHRKKVADLNLRPPAFKTHMYTVYTGHFGDCFNWGGGNFSDF